MVIDGNNFPQLAFSQAVQGGDKGAEQRDRLDATCGFERTRDINHVRAKGHRLGHIRKGLKPLGEDKG